LLLAAIHLLFGAAPIFQMRRISPKDQPLSYVSFCAINLPEYLQAGFEVTVTLR